MIQERHINGNQQYGELSSETPLHSRRHEAEERDAIFQAEVLSRCLQYDSGQLWPNLHYQARDMHFPCEDLSMLPLACIPLVELDLS
jgi:hypothetical protein